MCTATTHHHAPRTASNKQKPSLPSHPTHPTPHTPHPTVVAASFAAENFEDVLGGLHDAAAAKGLAHGDRLLPAAEAAALCGEALAGAHPFAVAAAVAALPRLPAAPCPPGRLQREAHLPGGAAAAARGGSARRRGARRAGVAGGAPLPPVSVVVKNLLNG